MPGIPGQPIPERSSPIDFHPGPHRKTLPMTRRPDSQLRAAVTATAADARPQRTGGPGRCCSADTRRPKKVQRIEPQCDKQRALLTLSVCGTGGWGMTGKDTDTTRRQAVYLCLVYDLTYDQYADIHCGPVTTSALSLCKTLPQVSADVNHTICFVIGKPGHWTHVGCFSIQPHGITVPTSEV